MKFTIILPTYNEAENISLLIHEIFSLELKEELHILVVDDNSPDGTAQIANDLISIYKNITIINRTHKLGLGSAYIEGFERALSDGANYIGQMDSDFSHPISKIPELLNKLNEFDIALGSRYIKNGSVDQNWPFWRKALSRWGNFYARTILGLPIKDVTGGFRIWKSEALETIQLNNIKSNGYIFLVELLYLANKAKLSFGEVPFYFKDRKWGKSKMNLSIQVEAAWRVWYLLLYYLFNPPFINTSKNT